MKLLVGIDSLKVRIPLNKVDYLSDELLDQWELFNTSTSETKRLGNKSVTINKKQCKTVYYLTRSLSECQESTSYLVIILNSKLLQENYLEGIKKENIKTLYNILINQNVVRFSYDDFITYSLCTDIDFKLDVELDELLKISQSKSFVKFIEKLSIMTMTSQECFDGFTLYKSSNNQGIEWSNRKYASIHKPFFKVYNKGLQISSILQEFSNEHLSHLDTSNLVRFEVTIRNKKGLKNQGFENSSIGSVINKDDDELTRMMKNALLSHLDKFCFTEQSQRSGFWYEEVIRTAVKILSKKYNMTLLSSILTKRLDRKKTQKGKTLIMDALSTKSKNLSVVSCLKEIGLCC